MSSSKLRNPTVISDSVHRQLNMYALAAGAAGVGALALVQPAEAKIVYTPANLNIPIFTHFPLDINNDGVNDLSFYWATSGRGSAIWMSGLQTNAVGGYSTFRGDKAAFALKQRVNIGSKLGFQAGTHILLWGVSATSSRTAHVGQWRNVQNRYLGVKFSIQGATHYGWVRLNVNIASREAVITGYAYETIPNTPVVAGKTTGQANADRPGPASIKPDTSNPATLGTLALGAQGLSLLRGRADNGQ